MFSYRENLLNLEKELSEKSSELVLFSNMGGSLFLFIVLVFLISIALFIVYTGDLARDYFDSLNSKRARAVTKRKRINKNESIIDSSNNLENLSRNRIVKLTLFEKLIYPFLFIHVTTINFIEKFVWKHDYLATFMCVFTVISLFVSGVLVFLHNKDVINEVYSEGVYKEISNFYNIKSYPIYSIDVNLDSSGYQIHYYKEDNSINKEVVSQFYVDENLKTLNDKSIGTITYKDNSDFLNYINSTNLENIGLSDIFISNLYEAIYSSFYSSIIKEVKEVKLLELPNL